MMLQQMEGLVVSHGGGRIILLYFDRNCTVVARTFFCNFREDLVNHESLAHFLIDGLDGVGDDCSRWSIPDFFLSITHDNKRPGSNLPIKLPIISCVPTRPGGCNEEHHL